MEQHSMESSTEKNHTVMESYNQTQQSKSLEDIMYQRMKNRERQRRYRERKRLLADMNNKSVQMIEPTTPQLPQPPPPPSSAIVPYLPVTRVRRTRDWKKDARRAHMAKQENTDAILKNENQASSLVSVMNSSEHMSKNGEKSKVKSGRRDWKAEARNKKTGGTK